MYVRMFVGSNCAKKRSPRIGCLNNLLFFSPIIDKHLS